MCSIYRRPYLVASILLAVLLLVSLSTPVFAADSDDDTPPVLHHVAVSETSAYPGQTILVGADAGDDDSGVQTITVSFQHNVTSQVISTTLLPNSNYEIDLPYCGILKIPSNAVPGAYTVSSVTVTDWEDNQARYTRGGENSLTELTQASFTIANTPTVPAPASCQVQVTGTDVSVQMSPLPGAGEIDKITLLFENNVNNRKLSFSLEQDDYLEGFYTKQFLISEWEPAGTFHLKKLTVKDSAGNKTTYSSRDDEDTLPLPFSASFSITSSYNDTQPPVLLSITAGQPAPNGNKAEVQLRVTATDNLSGIDYILVKFTHTTTGDKASKVLHQSDITDGNTYTGYLTLDDKDKRGLYQLDTVTLVDMSGNKNTYCRPGDVKGDKLPLSQMPTFQLS